jgi:hypothetical protein
VEVEFGQEPLDARAHGRLVVRRAGHDLGVAHPRQVEGVHGVLVRDQRDEVAEVLGLGAHGVQQDHGSAGARSEVAQGPLVAAVSYARGDGVAGGSRDVNRGTWLWAGHLADFPLCELLRTGDSDRARPKGA